MDIFKLLETVKQSTGVFDPAACEGCTHKINNPDGGHCYMFEHFQIGCMLYETVGTRRMVQTTKQED